MHAAYRHSQSGYLVPVIVVAVFVAALFTGEPANRPAIVIPLAIAAAVVLLFSRLTVEVVDEEVRVVFGPGMRVRRVRAADVESARVVQNPWWYGIGIRITPSGMLYNVAGRSAVEVRLANGKRFRVGTDEPEALRAAIDAAVQSSRGA